MVYKSTNNYAGEVRHTRHNSIQILMMFSFTFPLSSGFIYQALSDFWSAGGINLPQLLQGIHKAIKL